MTPFQHLHRMLESLGADHKMVGLVVAALVCAGLTVPGFRPGRPAGWRRSIPSWRPGWRRSGPAGVRRGGLARPGRSPALERRLARLGRGRGPSATPGGRRPAPRRRLDALRRLDRSGRVSPNAARYALEDSLARRRHPGLERAEGHREGLTVAVLDTRRDFTHPRPRAQPWWPT